MTDPFRMLSETRYSLTEQGASFTTLSCHAQIHHLLWFQVPSECVTKTGSMRVHTVSLLFVLAAGVLYVYFLRVNSVATTVAIFQVLRPVLKMQMHTSTEWF